MQTGRTPRPIGAPLAVVVVALLLLAACSLAPAWNALQRSEVLRNLLAGALEDRIVSVNQLFPCAAAPLASASARGRIQTGLEQVDNLDWRPEQAVHLKGTAYCLLGDREAAYRVYATTGT